jgi:E3 ubiquitin-protein ligase RFWD2
VYSWGRGPFGRLGTGREDDELVPTAVAPAVSASGTPRPRFVAVAAGAYHCLALDGSCSVTPSALCLCSVKLLLCAELFKNLELRYSSYSTLTSHVEVGLRYCVPKGEFAAADWHFDFPVPRTAAPAHAIQYVCFEIFCTSSFRTSCY